MADAPLQWPGAANYKPTEPKPWPGAAAFSSEPKQWPGAASFKKDTTTQPGETAPKINMKLGWEGQAAKIPVPKQTAPEQPSIASQFFAPEIKVGKMLASDPMGTLSKIGSATVQEGKNIAGGLKQDVEKLGGFTPPAALRSQDPSFAGPVADLAMLGGLKDTPGAIKSPALKTAKGVVEGPNHPDLRAAGAEGQPGFTTTLKGEFVNRGEGAAIAKQTGQAKPGTGGALHTEDLQKTPAAIPVAQTRAAGAAATPVHEIAAENIRRFQEAQKTPEIKESFRAATNTLKTLVGSPESIIDPKTGRRSGREGAEIINRRTGQETRTAFQARKAMDQFGQFTRSLGMEEQLSLVKWLQKPGEKLAKGLELSPEAQKFADTFKEWMDTYRRRLEALPQTEQMEFRQNYVPQMWKRPDDAAAFFGPKMGSKGFTKQHVFDDYEEGIRAGLAPLTTDSMELFSRYVENASKFIASREVWNDAKDANIVIFRNIADHIPHDYVKIKNPPGGTGNMGDAYAPPGFAGVYNAYASSRPTGYAGNILDTVQWGANRTTAFKLGFSLFHGTLTTSEAIANGMADAFLKMGKGNPIKGLAAVGKAPFKPLTSFVQGRRMQQAYLDGEFGTPEMQRIVRALTDANYDFMREGKLADEYRASRLPGFIKSFERGRLKMELAESYQKALGHPLAAPWREGAANEFIKTLGRTMQWVMEPIFQYYVPFVKNQAAYDSMKTWLDTHPQATNAEFGAYANKVASSTDNRFGEMNRDRIFWPATAKALGQVMLISYSYAMGYAREGLGAGFDIAKMPVQAVKKLSGKLPSDEEVMTQRVAWVIGGAVTWALSNAIYEYLKTGTMPQQPMDLIRARTGGVDQKTGQPERVTIPNPMNQFRNLSEDPAQEIGNKINTLWKTIYQIAHNEDWKGKPIWNPNDPIVKKMEIWTKYFLQDAVEPISAGKVWDKKPGTKLSTPERVLGLNPAGMRETAPAQFKSMIDKKYRGTQ